jgi:putative MFS transporter
MFTFRVLARVGLGGMLVVDPSILCEFLPPQSRGRFMVLLDFFWPVGFLLAILFWWVFVVQAVTLLDVASWRILFVVAAFPAFIAFLARLTIPESPFYYARHRKLKEAAGVPDRMTGSPVDPASLSGERMVPRAPISALFREGFARRSVMTLVV